MQIQTEENRRPDDVVNVDPTITVVERELMSDTSLPPDDVTEHANECLKNMLLRGQQAVTEVNKPQSIATVDLWDFAGQHLYYASHPVFLSPRGVYVLVHNLSKPLNALAEPCVRQGIHDVHLENPTGETNLENLLSWLVTVHRITPTGERMVDNTDGKLCYLRPPVLIVGTHADKPFEETKTMTTQIQEKMFGTEYDKHVIRPLFTVDNTRSNTQSKRSLLSQIMTLVTRFQQKPQGRQQAGKPQI